MNTYITLETDDICILSRENDKISVTTTRTYTTSDVTAHTTAPTPAPFAHWTLKEIHEQPSTIMNNINMGGRLLNDHEVKLGGLESMSAELPKMTVERRPSASHPRVSPSASVSPSGRAAWATSL